MNKHNHDKIRELQRPVLAIHAVHSGSNASKASHEQCDLLIKLNVCIGAKVMLTQNLWVEGGLVNGSIGTIENVVWSASADVKRDLSLALLVAVDRYSGPRLFTRDDGKAVILIFPCTREWDSSKDSCSRRQFPIILAFAIIIHKSQGLTLDRAVLDIREKDHSPGLAYVGISRVKKLSGLLFKRVFDKERFELTEAAKNQALARQRDLIKSMLELIF